MKVIRLIFVVFTLSFATELTAQGQGQGQRQGRPGGRGMAINIDSMKVHLNMTEDQVAEFKVINDEMREKRREIFESSNGDRESTRESMMALRAESDQQIKNIFTLEQWTKYEELKAEMRENRGKKPEGVPGSKRKKKKGKVKDTVKDTGS